jgi:hypothetical protein
MNINIYFPDIIIQDINSFVGSDTRHPIKHFIIVEDSIDNIHQPKLLTSEWITKRGRKTTAKRIQVGKTWIQQRISVLKEHVNLTIDGIFDDIVELSNRY